MESTYTILEYKHKYLKLISTLSFLLALTFMFIATPSLNIHATEVDLSGACDSFFSGVSGGGSTEERVNGISESRMGYLMYVIDAQSGDLKSSLKLFKVYPSSTFINGSLNLLCSRKGGQAPGITGEAAPWNVPPFTFTKDGYVSNEPIISAWMKGYDWAASKGAGPGTPNAAAFIATAWNENLAQEFINNKAYLVGETVLNFQWCEKGNGTDKTNEEDGMNYSKTVEWINSAEIETLIGCLASTGDSTAISVQEIYANAKRGWSQEMQEYYSTGDPIYLVDADMYSDTMKQYERAARTQMLAAAHKQYKELGDDFRFTIGGSNSGTGFTLKGRPILGTVPNCDNYRRDTLANMNPIQYSRVTGYFAPASEFVIEDADARRVGLLYYPNITSINSDNVMENSELNTYAVATMLIKAEKQGTHTWDKTKYPSKEGPAPEEPEGKKKKYPYVIEKNYRIKLPDGTLKDAGAFERTQTLPQILIEDEPLNKPYDDGTYKGTLNYKVIGWKTSTTQSTVDSLNWEAKVPKSIGKTGDSAGSTSLDTDYKVLYVLLEASVSPKEEKIDTNYLLKEASITRRIYTSKPDKLIDKNNNEVQNITAISFKWTAGAFTIDCPGHSYTIKGHNCCPGHDHHGGCKEGCTDTHECDGGCCGHTTTCGGRKTWEDDKVQFGLKNSEATSYPTVLATKEGWQKIVKPFSSTEEWIKDATRSIPGASSQTFSGMDFMGVIHRGKDKLTLAQWKNDNIFTSANTDLKDVTDNVYKVNNKSAHTRYNNDYYSDKFEISIVDNSADLATTRKATVAGDDDQICASETISYALETTATTTASVGIEVYNGGGKNGNGDSTIANYSAEDNGQINAKLPLTLGETTSSGVRVTPSNASISFTPYVEMIYDTDKNTEPQHAYVLGELSRSFTFASYAEIEWKAEDKQKLKLDSLQWSTHATAAQRHQFGTVLPGGATLTLRIASGDRQKVTLRTYQPMLTGAGKDQVELTGSNGGIPTDTSSISSNHEAFVTSVINDLEKLRVKQWWVGKDLGEEDESKKVWNDGGQLVDSDVELESGIGGKTSSAQETKYYLGKDGSGAGVTEGDLDAKAGETQTMYYTFFVDTSGNIKMIASSSAEGVSASTPTRDKSQGKVVVPRGSTSIENPTAKLINDRTLVITKLRAGLEYGGGNDTRSEVDWAPDGKWYNEAFDGITYVVNTTTVEVGFVEPGDREVVLDPKLCPANSGTANMFSEYYTAQFKTADRINEDGPKYIVGTFLNKEVPMTGMDMLFWSKRFYIPNVTTQDLN